MPRQNQAPEPVVSAREPRRERGRQRVESLLNAAASLFAEQGFEATTMTAIARRAGASIGSLYQFFPTRDLLADALRERFHRHVEEALGALAAQPQCRTAEGLASGLIALMKALSQERAAALALVDQNNPGDAHRLQVRNMMRQRIAALIRTVHPALEESEAMTRAVLTLHLLKLVHQMPQEEGALALEEALQRWLVAAFERPADAAR